MAANDRVLTLHPGGKQGVRIERAKYDGMVAALLAVVPEGPPGVAFQGLAERVRPHLPADVYTCLLYTSPSPRDATLSRMPSSA